MEIVFYFQLQCWKIKYHGKEQKWKEISPPDLSFDIHGGFQNRFKIDSKHESVQ